MKINFNIDSDFWGKYFVQFKKGQLKFEEQNMKTNFIYNYVEAILRYYSLKAHFENQLSNGLYSLVFLESIYLKVGFIYIHLLVFPFVYQINFRIGVLVHSSFAND